MKNAYNSLTFKSTLMTALRLGVQLQFPDGTFMRLDLQGVRRIAVGCGIVIHETFPFTREGLIEALGFRVALGGRFEKANRA